MVSIVLVTLKFDHSYHGNLLSTALVRDAHTSAALSPIIPDGLRDAGRAGDGGGKNVVGKGAGALLPASLLTTALAVPSTLTFVQGSLEDSGIGTGSRGSNCERCKHQSGGQRSVGRRREEHLSKSDCS